MSEDDSLTPDEDPLRALMRVVTAEDVSWERANDLLERCVERYDRRAVLEPLSDLLASWRTDDVDEARVDELMDLMDRVWGYCSPSYDPWFPAPSPGCE